MKKLLLAMLAACGLSVWANEVIFSHPQTKTMKHRHCRKHQP